MKAVKIILIVVGILVALMLIVPIFMPATTVVSVETEIALEPGQIFPAVASFRDRQAWDPWVELDSTTKVTVQSEPGYVGSTYTWEGERIGNGKMEVLSVEEDNHIESIILFGGMETPSTVTWDFSPSEEGTLVEWTYSQDTRYPFQRLSMALGKIFLSTNFKTGLSNLKEYLESSPPSSGMPLTVSVQTQPAMKAMVADGSGDIESIGEQLGVLYGKVMAAVQMQKLQITGPPFAQYLEYDEESGHTRYVAGIPVAEAGEASGAVRPLEFAEMQAAQAVHTGPYSQFRQTYDQLDRYIESNSLEIVGTAFEFYMTDPGVEPDSTKWETLISFPLVDGSSR